jgi:hypothetical protein
LCFSVARQQEDWIDGFASALLGGDPSSGRLVRAFAGRVKMFQVRRRCKATPAGLRGTERIRTP